LRLALHEAVAGVRPEQDLVGLIVEDVLTAVSLDREHGMAVAVVIAHHCHEQRFARPAGLHQEFALLQRIVLAIAVAIVRIIPAFDDTPMIHVGHRLDVGVDGDVDALEFGPGARR